MGRGCVWRCGWVCVMWGGVGGDKCVVVRLGVGGEWVKGDYRGYVVVV